MAAKTGYSGTPTSTAETDRFMSIVDETVKFTREAKISPQKIGGIEKSFKINVGEARDIGADVNSDDPITIKDLALQFPEGSIPTMFPISDVVVEYRDPVGTSTVRKSKHRSSSFTTGYMVTYVSVGIPAPMLEWIVKSSFNSPKAEVTT